MVAKIDYTAWRFWMDIANLAWGLAVCIYVYFMTRRKAIDQRFTKVDDDIKILGENIDERCGRQCSRINGLEKNDLEQAMRIQYMPSNQDIKELSQHITTLQGKLSELNGRLTGINRAVDLLNEYHLKPGGEGK